MLDIIPYNKPLGFTPLQAIDALKNERPELADVPITYAGRLDPMAEGLLLLVKGDAILQKQELLDLPKTYESKILFGFESDTFDILGLVENSKPISFDADQISSALQNFVGTHNFPYPNYSSKTVKGKPLWEWTKENRLSEIEIPTREMSVHSAVLESLEPIPWSEIYQTISSSIALVNGDFRQKEILQRWDEINKTLEPSQKFQVANITFTVSSGTYIRILAVELGKALDTSALLFHLKRTSIGDYILK